MVHKDGTCNQLFLIRVYHGIGPTYFIIKLDANNVLIFSKLDMSTYILEIMYYFSMYYK